MIYRHPRDTTNGGHPVTVERDRPDAELEFYGWTVDGAAPAVTAPAAVVVKDDDVAPAGDTLPEPNRGASRATWAAYAAQQAPGADLDGLTRDQLAATYGDA